MAERELVDSVAYCGLVCGVCRNATPEKEGCIGCRSGGGAEDCYQRKCCVKNGFDGCWECKDFPCDNGFFAVADEVWGGLCRGCVQSIRNNGIESYVDLVVSRMGDVVEYGDYRFRNEQEIVTMLSGDAGTQ